MGKIRVKTVGDEEAEKKQEEKSKKKKEAKKTVKASETTDEVSSITKKAEGAEEIKGTKAEKVEKVEKKKKGKKQAKKSARQRSKRYQKVKTQVDRTKVYPLSKALELLPQVHLATFDESVELHINTIETGVSGNVTLPHGTGKKTRVKIATEELIAEIESGKIDFDVLVAEPSIMPKLAKVAKFLGPKGLMPSPKNGTVTPHPEEVIAKYEGGQTRYKTETKFPLIHLTVGKLSFGTEKLTENITTVIQAVSPSRIQKVTLKSTMSIGIKVSVS